MSFSLISIPSSVANYGTAPSLLFVYSDLFMNEISVISATCTIFSIDSIAIILVATPPCLLPSPSKKLSLLLSLFNMRAFAVARTLQHIRWGIIATYKSLLMAPLLLPSSVASRQCIFGSHDISDNVGLYVTTDDSLLSPTYSSVGCGWLVCFLLARVTILLYFFASKTSSSASGRVSTTCCHVRAVVRTRTMSGRGCLYTPGISLSPRCRMG